MYHNNISLFPPMCVYQLADMTTSIHYTGLKLKRTLGRKDLAKEVTKQVGGGIQAFRIRFSPC